MKHLLLTGAALMTLSAGMISSCTEDNSYDDLMQSGGIDMTISVAGKGLSLPLGSTEKVLVTRILDPEESELLYSNEEGTMFIEKRGSMDPTSYSIPSLSFKLNTKVEEREAKLDVEQKWSDQMQAVLNTLPEGTALSQYPMLKNLKLYCEDVYVGSGKETTTIDFNATGVNQQLLSCRSFSFVKPIEARIAIQLKDLPSVDSAYEINLNDVAAILPFRCTVYDPLTRESYVTDTLRNLGDNYSDHITLRKEAGKTSVSWNSSVIYLSAADMSGHELVNDHGTIHRKETFTLQASTVIDRITVLGKEVVVGPKDAEGQATVELGKPVSIRTSIDFSAGELAKVSGRFNPQINDMRGVAQLNFSKDFDFLENENKMQMDLSNPEAIFTFQYPTHLKLISDILINGESEYPIAFNNLAMAPSSDLQAIHDANCPNGRDTIFDASDDSFTFRLSAHEENPLHNIYKSENLQHILYDMPDSIDFMLSAHADSTEYYDFELGKDITIGCDYKVLVPFTFNTLHIAYDNKIENIFKQNVKDRIHEVKDAELCFDAVNTLPLDIQVDIIAVDTLGNENPELVEYTPVSLQAGTLEKPSEQSFKMIVSLPDIAAIKDIILRASAVGENCELNANQYIQMSNIQLNIKDIEVDLNDK